MSYVWPGFLQEITLWSFQQPIVTFFIMAAHGAWVQVAGKGPLQLNPLPSLSHYPALPVIRLCPLYPSHPEFTCVFFYLHFFLLFVVLVEHLNILHYFIFFSFLAYWLYFMETLVSTSTDTHRYPQTYTNMCVFKIQFKTVLHSFTVSRFVTKYSKFLPPFSYNILVKHFDYHMLICCIVVFGQLHIRWGQKNKILVLTFIKFFI
jgi:hypothetical protein